MKKIIVKGPITALITPMIDDKIDFSAFRKILRAQVCAKMPAYILFGTTGEPLSLQPEEKTKLFYTAKEEVGDAPLICGISSPVTEAAIKSAECLTKLGADGLLVVTPYYYKCTDDGIYEHYRQIATATDLPIIVYNVPARTGIDLTAKPELLDRIAQIKNVCAIKNAAIDSSSNADYLKSARLPVYCGNDSLNYDSLKFGSVGSISVISNLLPKIEFAMHKCFFENNQKSVLYNNILHKICNVFDKIPNPIAIKYACSLKYDFSPIYRLPLTKPSDEQAQAIKEITLELLKIEDSL